MKRAIYVDYENVNISGLKGIESLTHDDVVKIFIGAQTTKLTMVDADRIFNSEATVELISNKFIGKNALDFIIMVHMGYDIAQELAKNYYIISKDKGYDPAIHEMRKMSGLTVKRVEDITAVLEQNPGFSGRIKQVLGIGKVKEIPDTTEHTVVGKGKKDTEEISKIKKDYVSEEKIDNRKSKKTENKHDAIKKSKKSKKEAVKPEKTVMKSEKEAVKPEKTVKKSEKEAVKPEKTVMKSEKEAVKPEKTVKKPKKEEVKPEKTVKKSKKEAVKPEKTVEKSEKEAVKPENKVKKTEKEMVRAESALSDNVPVESFKGTKRSYYRDQYYSNSKKSNYHRKSYDDRNTYHNQPDDEGVLNGLSSGTKVIQVAAVEETPINPVVADALAKAADPNKSYIKEVKIESPESPLGANIPLITTAPRTRYNSKDNSDFHNRNSNRYNGEDSYNGRNGKYRRRNGSYNGRNRNYNGRHGRYDSNRNYDETNEQPYPSSNETYNEGINTVNKFEYVKPELSGSEMQERDRQRDEAFALLAELNEQEVR